MDRIDFELLSALQNDGRLSNKELANRVGLAPSTTHHRVRRLISQGALTGIHAQISPSVLGIGLQAMVFLRVTAHVKNLSELNQWLLSLDCVISVWHLGGIDDYIIHTVARDTQHLREQVLDALTERAEIERIRTELIFDHLACGMPNLLEARSNPSDSRTDQKTSRR